MPANLKEVGQSKGGLKQVSVNSVFFFYNEAKSLFLPGPSMLYMIRHIQTFPAVVKNISVSVFVAIFIHLFNLFVSFPFNLAFSQIAQ